MKLSRRKFNGSAGAAAIAPLFPTASFAADYPVRPVRLVVGAPPGGVQDIIARFIGQWLSERLGKPFVIDNRPGFSTNLGAEAVVKSAPDGHTLLLAGTPNAINATLYDKLNFNFIRDIAPVAGISRGPLLMLVNPSVPARTVAEFIVWARANSGTVNLASLGSGTPPSLSGELFKKMAGVEMARVPYRGGGPAIIDLMGGQVHVYFSAVPEAMEHVRAGKIRALAVTSSMRLDALPEIPAVAEAVPGYEASSWQGIGAPANTPAEIIDMLNKAINAGLADPGMKSRISDLGGTVLTGAPAEFGKLIADETEKWGGLIRSANLKPD